MAAHAPFNARLVANTDLIPGRGDHGGPPLQIVLPSLALAVELAVEAAVEAVEGCAAARAIDNKLEAPRVCPK